MTQRLDETARPGKSAELSAPSTPIDMSPRQRPEPRPLLRRAGRGCFPVPKTTRQLSQGAHPIDSDADSGAIHGGRSWLSHEVLRGLCSAPKTLPPKLFYDDE